ncbi:hypothetical protein PsorP6_012551 [Peronosclerospora sorghi]|uniref:Uncharacterized protein n=1 Tax=Peronosclerospora sorghi TaxID=230839 RepID=A0ACC0WGT8_9STRA|nr:hypothetical protein PsorP6_012551 [Peronosclerospora sorghi]
MASLQEANKILAFNMKVRLWRVEVSLAVRKLLSLGCTYEPVESLQLATNCGIFVTATMNSHVFQVEKTNPPQYSKYCVDQVAGRSLANVPMCTVKADDYLVRIGSDDLLLCPQKLKQLHKDVAEYGNKVIIKQEHQKSSRRMLVLRFVCFQGSIKVDLRQAHNSGHILRVLDEMAAHHSNLAKRYDELIKQDRVAVQRLHSAKKLLMYVKKMTGNARYALMQDRRFQFMDKLRRCFATITDTKDHAIYKDVDMTKEMEQPIGNKEVELIEEQPENGSYDDISSFRSTSRILTTLVPEKVNDSGQHVERVTHVPALNLEAIPSKASTFSSIRTFAMEDGRSYLLALINVDLVSSLQDLAKTLKRCLSLTRN